MTAKFALGAYLSQLYDFFDFCESCKTLPGQIFGKGDERVLVGIGGGLCAEISFLRLFFLRQCKAVFSELVQIAHIIYYRHTIHTPLVFSISVLDLNFNGLLSFFE